MVSHVWKFLRVPLNSPDCINRMPTPAKGHQFFGRVKAADVPNLTEDNGTQDTVEHVIPLRENFCSNGCKNADTQVK